MTVRRQSLLYSDAGCFVLNIFIRALIAALFLLDDSMHVVIDWEILQFCCVVALIEYKLESVVHSIRDLVPL